MFTIMKIIGYKFELVSGNGDYNEYWREEHIVSPIYTSEEIARTAMNLVKIKMLKKVKSDMNRYIHSQIDCEISNNRNVNVFLCNAQKGLMQDYKEVLKKFSSASIQPIFAYDEPTEEFEKFNIGD